MNEPFASVRANPPPGEVVRFDVTELVAGWQQHEFQNHGMLLLSKPGNRLHFYASEHPDPRGRPRLVIVLMAKNTSE